MLWPGSSRLAKRRKSRGCCPHTMCEDRQPSGALLPQVESTGCSLQQCTFAHEVTLIFSITTCAEVSLFLLPSIRIAARLMPLGTSFYPAVL